MKDWEGSEEDERADRAAVKAINNSKGRDMKKGEHAHRSELEHEAESHHEKHHAKRVEKHVKEHMHKDGMHHAALRSKYKGDW